MNGAGDIGLGYSVSSTSISPSIRFTGRLASDPLNQMTQGEGTIINGSGYQTHSAGRWGDYAMMAVDPVDDCTFWFTTEYYNSVSSAGWRTRVGSVKLANCGVPSDTAPTVTITNPANGSIVSGAVNVTATASDDHGVTQVEFFVDGASIGVDTTTPYSASWNTTTYSNGVHTVSATATDTIGQTANHSVIVTVQNTAVAIHVGDLDGTVATVRRNWNATVTITVHNASEAPVVGITVTGNWSGGTTGSASCTTNASGQCSVTSPNMNSKKTSVTFTITNLSGASGYTYNSSSNHDPDGGDSNGTAITILR
jgi:hypothetical protein